MSVVHKMCKELLHTHVLLFSDFFMSFLCPVVMSECSKY